jgi:hypothetical protein
MKDVQSQASQPVCDLVSTNAGNNLLVNREAPPFDNPDLRSGTSTSSCRRTARARSSITPVPPPASSRRSKGLSIMVNSQYNGWRMEDVWLDQ